MSDILDFTGFIKLTPCDHCYSVRLCREYETDKGCFYICDICEKELEEEEK